MRFDVNALRWIMVLINASALCLVCWGAFVLFQGERDELTLALPDPSRFEVKERAKGTTQSKELADVLRRIGLRKPEPAAPRPVVEAPKTDLPPPAGGPLATEWEVASVYSAGGKGMASLTKKTDTTTVRSANRRTRGRRTTRPQRGRTPDPKAAARRGPVSPTKHVVAGKVFYVGDKTYECTEVDFEERTVFYKDGSRLYRLEPPEIETILEVGEDGILTMTGIPLDEDEAAALSAEEESQRGTIQMPGREAPKASGRPAPRTPNAGRVTPRAARQQPNAGKPKLTPEDIKKMNDSMKGGSNADREAVRKAMQGLKNK